MEGSFIFELRNPKLAIYLPTRLNEADVDLVRAVYAWDAIFIGQPFPTATRIDEIVALNATIFQSSTSAFSSTSRISS